MYILCYTYPMPPKPLYHALAAISYIVLLVSTAVVAPDLFNMPDESMFYPMLALSTLVLSVSVMAFLFFYQPIVYLLDGQREKAVRFFLHTVGMFACMVVTLFLISVFVQS
jgi:hypothetical protein